MASVLPKQPEQPYGGTGGDGAGLVVEAPAVHIDDTAKARLRWIDTTTFCQEYGLGDEIRQLLIDKNYQKINALFEEDETQLKNLPLKVGHIAELKWAMKKMLLLEYPDIELTSTKSGYAPELSGTEPTIVKILSQTFTGGTGGAGGDALERGGHGGTGKSPQIGIEDFHRFSVIRGGKGGAGGSVGEKPNVVARGVTTDPTPQCVGNIDGMIGTSELPEVVAAGVNTGPAPQRNLLGGQGGVGGQGVVLGGPGGVGAATKIPVLYVALFGKIAASIPCFEIENAKASVYYFAVHIIVTAC
ncbi:hypothetical protein K438DRAFT_1764956 [Mycena galopus ATCC 62051]|nr:hypothetical protein K438DRAFT_1764956 [Mycena galopus ATCC 62051]